MREQHNFHCVELWMKQASDITKIENKKEYKMSCAHNDILLEKYYDEYLEEGYSKKEAEKLARQKLEDWSY